MILKTILVLLLLDTFLRIFFKIPNNTANCGIFSWAGKNPKKFNKGKFDVLGIFNEKRGTDSCGITIDGEIYTGTDKNKVYKDFISNVEYDLPKVLPTVIGHTRWATTGVHNSYNAHPFGFGDNNGMYNFIGVHNGSLLNDHEFSKKRNISKTEEYSTENKVSRYRHKIDSELLLECLYKDNDFSVLKEYYGAAALIFTKTTEPNVTYYYHGKSKKYRNDKELEEERPLYYYKETRNSLYVSSMRESLVAIGGTDKTIGEFRHNIVYKVTDGDISKATLYKIKRQDTYQKNYTNVTYPYGSTYGWDWDGSYDHNLLPAKSDSKSNSKSGTTPPRGSTINIYNEIVDMNDYKGKVYLYKFRYFRNGHAINGCYVWIKDYGYYRLGTYIKQSEKEFWNIVNRPFYQGEFLDSKDPNVEKAFVPIIHKDKDEINDVPLLFFHDGVRVKEALDYAACVQAKDQGKPFTYEQLSMCSCHPVIDISKNYKSSTAQGIMLGGGLYSGTISPLGSDKIYTIEKGNLTKVKKKEKKVESLKKVFDDVESKEKKERFENSSIEDLVEEIFGDFFQKIPLHLKSLKKYENNIMAKDAIDILEITQEYVSEMLILEKKD